MSKTERLQWQDPTADSAIFGVDSGVKQSRNSNRDPFNLGSIGSLTQAEIDEGIHMARIRLANGGSHAQFRATADALRSARRQLQGRGR